MRWLVVVISNQGSWKGVQSFSCFLDHPVLNAYPNAPNFIKLICGVELIKRQNCDMKCGLFAAALWCWSILLLLRRSLALELATFPGCLTCSMWHLRDCLWWCSTWSPGTCLLCIRPFYSLGTGTNWYYIYPELHWINWCSFICEVYNANVRQWHRC